MSKYQEEDGEVNELIELLESFKDQVGRDEFGWNPQDKALGRLSEVAATVAVGMALTPFLQSVATHFGEKFAGAIESGTRSALRAFLRRELPGNSSGNPESPQPVNLRSERGWVVTVHADLPAEAIAHLLALDRALVPELLDSPVPRIEWSRDWQRWILLGAIPQGVGMYGWNRETNAWDKIH
ncbi:hypothetical protein OG520_22180 [Streptomyces sp. NBC_00984]|uniref:hypothetical protein n=1 Tax=Streptomyces sp. NBC_00984 TaxID=2903700 RepID=UPI00386D8D22|nr:hypothetical protein OG520_22180 [Streptomyces sp. NBC_00984]